VKKLKKAAGQSVLPFPAERRTTPEALAKRRVALAPTTPSGHRVKIAVTLFLPRELAEWLSARAIREGRNTAAVLADIVAAESRRK
jgi:hypothetical protein